MDVNIIGSIEANMNLGKVISMIESTSLGLPTVNKVLSRDKREPEVTYQGCELVSFEVGVEYYKHRKPVS